MIFCFLFLIQFKVINWLLLTSGYLYKWTARDVISPVKYFQLMTCDLGPPSSLSNFISSSKFIIISLNYNRKSKVTYKSRISFDCAKRINVTFVCNILPPTFWFYVYHCHFIDLLFTWK